MSMIDLYEPSASFLPIQLFIRFTTALLEYLPVSFLVVVVVFFVVVVVFFVVVVVFLVVVVVFLVVVVEVTFLAQPE